MDGKESAKDSDGFKEADAKGYSSGSASGHASIAESKSSYDAKGIDGNSQFTKTEVEELVALCDKMVSSFFEYAESPFSGNNVDGHPWVRAAKRPELGNLEIYSSKTLVSKIHRWQSVCVLPYPMNEVFACINNPKERVSWDRGITEYDNIPVAGNVVVQRYASDGAGPVSPRDTKTVGGMKTLPDGRIVIGGGHVGDEDFGCFLPKPGVIRMQTFASGWVLESVNGGSATKVVHGVHIDLKGWFIPIVQQKVMGNTFHTFYEDLLNKLAGKDKEKKTERDEKMAEFAADISALMKEGGGGDGAMDDDRIRASRK